MIPFRQCSNRVLTRAALSLLAIVALSKAMAQDRLSAGADVTFRTLYSYDSNLFYTRDADSDKFSTVAMNMHTVLSYKLMGLGFGGGVEDRHYELYTDQNHTSYDLKANLSFGDEPFKFSAFSQRTNAIAPLDTTNLTRVERDTNQGYAVIDVMPAYLFGIILSGNYEDRTYVDFDEYEYLKNGASISDGTYVDFDEYEYLKTGASISVYGMYDRHTKVGLRYFRGEQDYDEDIRYDAEITRSLVFVEYEHDSSLSAKVELGYETFKFKVPRWIQADLNNAEGPYAKAAFKYVPNETLELEASLGRNIELSNTPSSYFNTKVKTGGSVVYRPITRVRLEGVVYFTHTDEYLAFDNDTYGARLKAAYAFSEWSELELAYEYDERNATASGADYVRHMVSFGLALRW